MKNIVKSIYDIAEAQDVTIDVAFAMLEENFRNGEATNKGAEYDYTQIPDTVLLSEAREFAISRYDAIVKARNPELYADDEDKFTFEQLFEEPATCGGGVDGD